MPLDEEHNLRSEAVQEIFSTIPHWILRYGISLIFMILLLLLLGSWFIKYPDRIETRGVITTLSPPAKLVARTNGRITFFVSDNQQVQKDDYLAVIENPANTEDIRQITSILKQLKSGGNTIGEFNDCGLEQKFRLGDVQSVHTELVKALRELKIFHELALHSKHQEAIGRRIQQYEQLNLQMIKQNKLIAEELGLSQKRFNADSLLLKDQIIAEFDVHVTKKILLQTKQLYEKNGSDIIANDIQIAQLKAQLTEIQLERAEKSSVLENAIHDGIKNLESKLLVWEQQYVLKAPIDGKVTFTQYWSNNHYVNQNDEVLTIVPDDRSLFALAYLPVSGSGKVTIGQRVNIRIDNYPYYEYGQLNGTVESVSLVPKDNMYTVHIALNKGLETSYKKTLEFRQEMQGSAEIITRDLRVIERIFNRFKAISDKTNPS